MIRVTVELVPFGVEEKKTTIGTVIIGNDRSGDRSTGHYTVRMEDDRGFKVDARVQNHLRMLGVWPLIIRAIEACEKKIDEEDV